MPPSAASTSSSHRNRRLGGGSGPSSATAASNTSRSTNATTTSFASTLKENNPLFNTYEHLTTQPRADSALQLLRKAASAVKPLMRKRHWHVGTLAEFLPLNEPRLLGLNINHGEKICIRLRYNNSPDTFMPFEQILDTLLHELAHIEVGPHDARFHKLWDELRDEHEVLLRKGYTGEGFLSEGRRLGGRIGAGGPGVLPPEELRRLARANAEKRQRQGLLSAGSGQRLGGTPLHQQASSGRDIRQIIADQVIKRNSSTPGSCASGTREAESLSQVSVGQSFRTKAEEDDANDRAISQALLELMQEEEEQKIMSGGLGWDEKRGMYEKAKSSSSSSAAAASSALSSKSHPAHPSEQEQLEWALKASMQTDDREPPSRTLSDAQSTTSSRAPSIPWDSKPKTPSHLSSSSTSDARTTLSKNAHNPKPPSSTTSRTTATATAAPLIDLSSSPPTTAIQSQWPCQICTCINPATFLACDACGIERTGYPPSSTQTSSQTKPAAPAKTKTPSRQRWEIPEPAKAKPGLGWLCGDCGAFMEHQWWTCSACGRMKEES